MDIITAIGVLASIIFSSISLWQTYQLRTKDKEDELRKQLNRIIEIAVEYPYLEYQPFIDKWLERKLSGDEKYMRYDMFCNLLFNFLADVYDFYNGDVDLIENFCDIETWINMHKLNWMHPIEEDENIKGYSLEFQDFINSYIKD